MFSASLKQYFCNCLTELGILFSEIICTWVNLSITVKVFLRLASPRPKFVGILSLEGLRSQLHPPSLIKLLTILSEKLKIQQILDIL